MTPDDPEIDHFETFDLLASMVTLVQADGHVLRVNGALENTLAVSRRALQRSSLLDWLVDRPGLRRVRLGSLRKTAADQGAYLQLASGDMAVIGVTLLYRLGRLKAEQYLQILGGFVRPDVH